MPEKNSDITLTLISLYRAISIVFKNYTDTDVSCVVSPIVIQALIISFLKYLLKVQFTKNKREI